jgi:hypothetical protein
MNQPKPLEVAAAAVPARRCGSPLTSVCLWSALLLAMLTPGGAWAQVGRRIWELIERPEDIVWSDYYDRPWPVVARGTHFTLPYVFPDHPRPLEVQLAPGSIARSVGRDPGGGWPTVLAGNCSGLEPRMNANA